MSAGIRQDRQSTNAAARMMRGQVLDVGFMDLLYGMRGICQEYVCKAIFTFRCR